MTERVLDYLEVEAALARAAWTSVHGTAEDKNGRFRGEVAMASRMPPRDTAKPSAEPVPFAGEPGPVNLTIETVREGDTGWLASVPELRGASAYGHTEAEAIAKVQALALRMLAARIEAGEAKPTSITLIEQATVPRAAE